MPSSYRIANPDNDFDRPQLTRAEGGVAVGVVGAKFYKAELTKLRHANRTLFSSSVPHIAAIRQTWDSDCYFEVLFIRLIGYQATPVRSWRCRSQRSSRRVQVSTTR